ncbi:hypothetical protein Tco_0672638 [Tanacetum coccineum]
MADNWTMAELLQAPTEGYEDAIVIPEINANFELKHGLINLVPKSVLFIVRRLLTRREYLKVRILPKQCFYQGPTIPTSSPKEVERRTEVTKDTVFPTNNGITEDVQPPVENQNPVSKPVVAPVSAPMPNPKPSIPYPSRRNNEKRSENANEQIEKFYKIFKDMSFEISFMDALTLMPKFDSTLKALIGNKEKLSEMDQKGTFLFSSTPFCDSFSSFRTRNLVCRNRKELKICEAKTAKSSIDEPPEVKLKDLPPHLEYAFLEDNNKLPVIIAKDFEVDERRFS